MAEVVPFKAVHYDPSRVRTNRVIAPPYDVIDPALQQWLYEEDPHNIVRLILNRPEPGDDGPAARYARAADFLRQTLADGVLVEDAEPALYQSVQRFAHPMAAERIVERAALFVALRLVPYDQGVVLPHEETHSRAKADRLDLMRSTTANPEPIYGLYEDREHTLAHLLQQARELSQPMLEATGTADGDHLLYRVADPETIRFAASFLAERRVWIADGHHRYETALTYGAERRQLSARAAGAQPYDYILIGLSAFEDPGLVVLPTHRLVNGVLRERLEMLVPLLRRHFHVERLAADSMQAWLSSGDQGATRLVVVTAGDTLGLTLRDPGIMASAVSGTHGAAWMRLDVTVLQALVLDRTLGISWQELATTPNVAYTRDAAEAVEKVHSGEFQLACLLREPSVNEVRDVAAAGDKMPQKSTFFYPKLWSGIVLRLLR